MLQNWFILLPELFLISFFPVAWAIEMFRREKTPKTFFTLAQFLLSAVIGCSILFYNKSAFPEYWQNTPFSTLFKSFAFLLALAWFYLSSKWFLNKSRPSVKFCSICFALLFGFNLLASASSLLTLAAAMPFVCFFYYRLILRHWDIERVEKTAGAYAVNAAFFCLLLWGGAAILGSEAGSFEYAAVKAYFSAGQTFNIQTLTAVLMILSALMFLMAMVPFHSWFTAFVSVGVLPVCGFITLVPPLICLCALINLMRDCLTPFIGFAAPVITVFASLSLLVGALAANRENNIRRMFAFLSIYGTGFTAVGLSVFSGNNITAAFAYAVIAILSFTGVYTVFLGLKSRGEYLSELSEISGFYQIRPFMAAVLLVFLFSLVGLAPTLGFFGSLSVINGLVETESWGRVLLLLVTLLFVANACLRVIRAVYFEPLAENFDRTDKTIYICLFINAVVVVLALVNPAWILRDALVILGGLS